MPKYSYGPAPKGRVLRFVDALLQYANGELGDYELKDLLWLPEIMAAN